jgi:hypothetical protein
MPIIEEYARKPYLSILIIRGFIPAINKPEIMTSITIPFKNLYKSFQIIDDKNYILELNIVSGYTILFGHRNLLSILQDDKCLKRHMQVDLTSFIANHANIEDDYQSIYRNYINRNTFVKIIPSIILNSFDTLMLYAKNSRHIYNLRILNQELSFDKIIENANLRATKIIEFARFQAIKTIELANEEASQITATSKKTLEIFETTKAELESELQKLIYKIQKCKEEILRQSIIISFQNKDIRNKSESPILQGVNQTDTPVITETVINPSIKKSKVLQIINCSSPMFVPITEFKYTDEDVDENETIFNKLKMSASGINIHAPEFIPK